MISRAGHADMSAGVDADSRAPLTSGTPMEFMQRIGWLSSDGRPLEPGKTLVGAGADPTTSSTTVPLPHFDYDGIAPSKAFGSALQSVQAPEPSATGRSARGGRGGARGGAASLAAPRVSTSNPYMIAGVAGKSPGKPDKGRFRADVPRVGKGGSVFGAERSSGFAPSKK